MTELEHSRSAISRWAEMIEAEHAQSERVRGGVSASGDSWQPFAERFRGNPLRRDDPLVERLAQEIGPSDTLLDVGAGGGRLALPLALRCRRVVAVEPSQSMVAVLRQGMDSTGVQNISVVEARWEEAETSPGDVVLCSQVLYTVKQIEHFIRKLEAHAGRRVLVVLFTRPPQSHLDPFWPRVHGEKRLSLPALRELLDILWELGIYPDIEMLPPQPAPAFDNWDEAQRDLRSRLYVTPGSHEDRLLDAAMRELLEEAEGRVRVRGTSPRRAALISWSPP